MAPNTNDLRRSGNSIATHRRVYSSMQASILSGSRDRTSGVSSPQRSNSFPNGMKAGDLAETLRQVQVERAILQEIGKDSQPVKSQHYMVAGRPRIRRCISDVSVDIRRLEERENRADAIQRRSPTQSGPGPTVKRRVSFSDRHAVHVVDARDVYDRTTPEWVETNFTAARMRYIRLELLTLRKEMHVHPHSKLTAKGLPLPGDEEPQRSSAPAALLRQRGRNSISQPATNSLPLERIESGDHAAEGSLTTETPAGAAEPVAPVSESTADAVPDASAGKVIFQADEQEQEQAPAPPRPDEVSSGQAMPAPCEQRIEEHEPVVPSTHPVEETATAGSGAQQAAAAMPEKRMLSVKLGAKLGKFLPTLLARHGQS